MIVPDNPQQWAALAAAMRENLEGDLVKLVAFYRVADQQVKLTVTKTATRVTLPDGSKLPLNEWIGATA